jgi:hypothetical protein
MGFPTDAVSEKPDTVTVDPTIIDLGARTDGKKTGDPRNRAKVDPDGDAYE